MALIISPQTRLSLLKRSGRNGLLARGIWPCTVEEDAGVMIHTQDNRWRLVPVKMKKSHRKDLLRACGQTTWPHDHLCNSNPSLSSASCPGGSTITGLGGGYRLSPAVSDWPPDSSLRRSRTSGPACPPQLGSPRWRAVPPGSGCAACHQKWAAGRTGLDALDGGQCLSSLVGGQE